MTHPTSPITFSSISHGYQFPNIFTFLWLSNLSHIFPLLTHTKSRGCPHHHCFIPSSSTVSICFLFPTFPLLHSGGLVQELQQCTKWPSPSPSPFSPRCFHFQTMCSSFYCQTYIALLKRLLQLLLHPSCIKLEGTREEGFPL